MNELTPEHILLTVLGTNLRPAKYVWWDKEKESQVASAALYGLLPEAERPNRVLALCTPEAERKSLPVLREALGQACPVDLVRVSSDPDDEAIHTCLARLAESVPEGAHLTVDVTHGFRHLSFLTYVGVLYLTALRGIQLRAAYYGMLNEPPKKSPFFDVRPLVELPRWFHALQVLAGTGSAHVMADLVEASDGKAGQVGPALRTLSEAYSWGLPIELGYLARRFLAEQVKPLRDLLRGQRLPLADELVGEFAGVLAKQLITQNLSETDWKARVRLDRAELERQARIIDGFLARRDYPIAFGLMREWLVLWAMWRTGVEDRWLVYRDRRPTEGLLHEIKRRTLRGERLTPDQATIGRAWEHLTALRNPYAHHGLDKGVTLSTEDQVQRRADAILGIWQETLRAVPEFSLPPPPEGRMLVSPVGMRPGVLFSALLAADPHQVSRCLVICSAETESAVRQACEAAGYSGEVVLLRLDDPFAGVNELGRRIGEAKRHLLDAGEVFVNVTGGTSLMGVLAERIAGKASRLDRAAYRFALVDRRPPAAQEVDPYQAGEVCWLDDQPGEGGA